MRERLQSFVDDFEPSGIPAEPNIKFTIVLAAPKKYVWDSWHLPKDKGGGNVPITKGDPGDVYWPGSGARRTWSATPDPRLRWWARSLYRKRDLGWV